MDDETVNQEIKFQVLKTMRPTNRLKRKTTNDQSEEVNNNVVYAKLYF